MDLDTLFDRLYPICRSIMGSGIRDSLKIINEYMPLEFTHIPTGTKILDWTVPQEWVIRDAKLVGPDDVVYASIDVSNLHIVNYSTGVDTVLSREELEEFLYSIPELPDAIPYVTSYYKRRWGFCLPHKIRECMPSGDYSVTIDAEHKDGFLTYGEAFIKGESEEEVLISTYLCHPSMANNELSGPLAFVELYNRIKKWKHRKYSYRFYIGPETIGSIAYLSKNCGTLKRSLVSGFVLTCLGGPEKRLSLKLSRKDDALVNQVARYLGKNGLMDIDLRDFVPTSGSDERQFCSPGFNLPVGQFAKTLYANYDGYHNSMDDKAFMGVDSVEESVDQLERFLLCQEYSGFFWNTKPYGEIQLGRRGLYPNINDHRINDKSTDVKMDGRTQLNCILTILNYSDGNHTMLEIAEKCDVDLLQLIPIIQKLEGEKLLSRDSKDVDVFPCDTV